METRKEEERQFHNRLRDSISWQRWSKDEEDRYGSQLLWSNMKFYSVERASRSFVKDWLRRHCRGKTALDYCCGAGQDAIFMAESGATVSGIDISEASIENCRRQVAQSGVGEDVGFHVMDAEALKFEDDRFDVINIYGTLHHLDLDKAMAELSRVLKPQGAIICTESLKHNPFIRLYRKMTPHLRTAWETDHILGKEDLMTVKRYFGRADVRFFHLATLFAVPLRKTAIFNIVLTMLEKIDALLLRLPFIKWWAWQAVFVLSEPKKERGR